MALPGFFGGSCSLKKEHVTWALVVLKYYIFISHYSVQGGCPNTQNTLPLRLRHWL